MTNFDQVPKPPPSLGKELNKWTCEACGLDNDSRQLRGNVECFHCLSPKPKPKETEELDEQTHQKALLGTHGVRIKCSEYPGPLSNKGEVTDDN